MKILSVVLSCGVLASAAEMPSGYFHGAMAGFEGSKASGVLRARAAEGGELSTCGFDVKTYMEFEKRRITVDKLREGDPLEVLAYRRPGETTCYILSLEVIAPVKVVRPNRRVDVTPAKSTRPPAVRHGTQNIAGVVIQISVGALTLRTRKGEETFLLRRDTRYLGNGLKMEWGDVVGNQRVLVEASRNLDGQMEAYQLTWGELSVR